MHAPISSKLVILRRPKTLNRPRRLTWCTQSLRVVHNAPQRHFAQVKMAQQLAACARQLFEGASGSAEQRAANAWLMQFQAREEAWQAALQLLERPVRDPATQQGAPELVAMQILRLKTQQDWTKISAQQQQVVRQVRLWSYVIMRSDGQRKLKWVTNKLPLP